MKKIYSMMMAAMASIAVMAGSTPEAAAETAYMAPAKVNLQGATSPGVYQFIPNISVEWTGQTVTATPGGLRGTLTINDGKPIAINRMSIHNVSMGDGDGDGGPVWHTAGVSTDHPASLNFEDGDTPQRAPVLFTALRIELYDIVRSEVNPEAGTYVITLPEGIVLNPQGAINPEQSFSFKIIKGTTKNPVVSPLPNPGDDDEPLPPFGRITVKWEGLTIERITASPFVVISGPEEDNVVYLPVTVSDSGEEAYIDVEEVFRNPGVYAFQWDNSSVWFSDGTINDILFMSYNIASAAEEETPSGDTDEPGGDNPGDDTDNPGEDPNDEGEDSPGEAAVGAVQPDADGRVSVYTLDGVSKGRYPAESLREALPEGLYIVNGRKTLIR